MSPIKEIAIRMIQDISDDKIVYILHIFNMDFHEEKPT